LADGVAGRAGNERERLALPIDSENIRVIDVEEFRVFNNPLYNAYNHYKAMMPPFNEMHALRKSAGQASQSG
jgi:hypothetical protein